MKKLARFPHIVLPEELRRGGKAYDLMAAVPLVVWYGLTALGQSGGLFQQIGGLSSAGPSFQLTIVILSKLATSLFAFIVIGLLFARRPPKAGAQGMLPKAMAILGTYLSIGILSLPRAELPAWMLACSTALIFAGMAFAAYALVFLGRSISMMPEARKLVTAGPYSVIRHPLYLGEEIAFIGAVIQYFSPWAVMLFAAQLCCQLYRMRCEETVLAETFPEYRHYTGRTKRLIPSIY